MPARSLFSRSLFLGLCLLTTVAAVATHAAKAGPGQLDSTFGNGGVVRGPVGVGEEVLALPDGRTAVAGQNGDAILVAIYDRNGQLDPSFSGGIVRITRGKSTLQGVYALEWQRDGKLLLATDDWVARLLPDGSLDPEFAGDGFFDYYFRYAISDIAVQSDGQIVIGGTDGFGNSHPLFIRLLSNGSRDRTFGRKGRAGLPPGQRRSTGLFALDIQPDDRIVAVGERDTRRNGQQFYVARLTADGARDASFGGNHGNGVVTLIGRNSYAKEVEVQPDGRIVVGGDNEGGGRAARLFIARYLPNGRTDRRFAQRGIARVRSANSLIGGLALQHGRVNLGASSGSGTTSSFVVFRLRRSGRLDASFGSRGRASTRIGTDASVFDLTVQRDGKLIGTGYGGSGFALVRYARR